MVVGGNLRMLKEGKREEGEGERTLKNNEIKRMQGAFGMVS